MPLPVIANVYRCAFEWSNSSQTAANVIHVRGNSGANPVNVATCLDTHVTRTMWNSVADSFFVTAIIVTELDGSSASYEFLTGNVAKYQGTQTGEFSPSTAAIVKLPTALRGRSHRGRIFLPFTAEAVMVDGVLLGATQTSQTTAWRAFRVAVGSDVTTPLEMGVASYKHATFQPATDVFVESPFGTQRRRQSRLR